MPTNAWVVFNTEGAPRYPTKEEFEIAMEQGPQNGDRWVAIPTIQERDGKFILAVTRSEAKAIREGLCFVAEHDKASGYPVDYDAWALAEALTRLGI